MRQITLLGKIDSFNYRHNQQEGLTEESMYSFFIINFCQHFLKVIYLLHIYFKVDQLPLFQSESSTDMEHMMLHKDIIVDWDMEKLRK